MEFNAIIGFEKLVCRIDDSYVCKFDYDFYYEKCELVKLIIIILVVVIGVIGNVLSLLVWIKGDKCSKISCSMYFRLLAATDLIVLIVSCGFPFFYEYVTNIPVSVLEYPENHTLYDEFNYHVPVLFFKRVGPQISPWLLTVITIERMLSLTFPFKFQLKGCKKRAVIIYVCILVLFLGLGSVNVFIDRLLPSMPSENINDIVLPLSNRIEEGLKIWSLCILPLVLMAVCNIISVIQILRMRVRMGSANVHNGSSTRRRSGIFTAICLASGLMHCVSVIPTLVYTLADNQFFSELTNPEFLTYIEVRKFLITPGGIFISSALFCHTVAVCTLYLNNSVNFLLFCVTGTDFRKDLISLLTVRK